MSLSTHDVEPMRHQYDSILNGVFLHLNIELLLWGHDFVENLTQCTSV